MSRPLSSKLLSPVWSSASSEEFQDAAEGGASNHTSPSPDRVRRPSSLEIPSLMTSSQLLKSSYSNTSVIPSPMKTPSKASESSRRRKLDSLRRRMVDGVVQVNDDDEEEEYDTTSSEEEEEHIQVQFKNTSGYVAESTPCKSTIPTCSDTQILVSIPPPPPPGSMMPMSVTSKSSSTSYSTGSSKSNTFERALSVSDQTNNPNKSNSLDRGLSVSLAYARSASGLSSKSNSLTRELSVSGADVFVTAFESENELQDYDRRNSEAAEFIEQLTCNLVQPRITDKIVEEEKEDSPGPSANSEYKGTEYISTPTLEGSQMEISLDATLTTTPIFTAPPTSLQANVQPLYAASTSKSGRSVSDALRQPDIIASNVVRNESCQVSNQSTADVPPNEPVPPPRRRRSERHSLWSNCGSVESLPSQFINIPKNDRLNQSANARISQSLSARRFKDPVLENTTLKNLDTGEEIPLAQATNKVPFDPISFHVFRRMSTVGGIKPNYAESVVSSSYQSDSDSMYSSGVDTISVKSMPVKKGYLSAAKKKTVEAKRQLHKSVHQAFKKTYTTARSVAGEVVPDEECDYFLSHKMQGDQSTASEEEEEEATDQSTLPLRVRSRHQKKGPFDFEQLRQVQDLGGEHTGAVWCLKFSLCGRLLATAGQDNVIRVWVLTSAYSYFNDMRQKYNMEVARKGGSSNLDALYQLDLQRSTSSNLAMAGLSKADSLLPNTAFSDDQSLYGDDACAPFMPKPFCCYRGHSADVLDIAWSKNYFVLSSSMDRTVRLWHASRTECLCCFQHIDFVTCIAFLPKDDRYFVSGSLDAKLRLWHIPDKKVEGNKLVTALTFVKNGKFAVAGTFDGRCIFYTTDQLKYHTMIDVRSSRGKNARGHKVTGLCVYQDKLLVTSNDSRIRLYDLRDLTLTCKYKGATNAKSQIRASFSPNASHIICGSEDRFTYLWRTSIDSSTLSVRKDRNGAWERVRAHNAVVTAAIFAPKPELIFQQVESAKQRLGLDGPRPPATPTPESEVSKSAASRLLSAASSGFKNSSNNKKTNNFGGDVIVSADLTGEIYVFLNKTRMKTGASTFFSQ